MITVIIPTMWKGKEISVMLPRLNDHPLVGEIILIDNDPIERNDGIKNLSKVNYVSFGYNIFVGAAWNYGWKHAAHEKLLIINDDVMFSIDVVDAIYDSINEETGAILFHAEGVQKPTSTLELNQNKTLKDISLHPNPKLRHRAATLIGIHKNNYSEIPGEFKIYFTDTWLFDMCVKRGLPNKEIRGAEVRTEMSKTVKHFRSITQHEWKIYKEVYSRHNLTKG